MRRGRYLWGAATAVATGLALLYIHANWPSPLTRLLAPVSGSGWEQSKLVFWGYLVGALVIWTLSDRRESRAGHCMVLVLLPPVTAVTCWLLPGWSLWPVSLVIGAALYGAVLCRRETGGELLWYTLAILVGIAYIFFTVMPPSAGPFLDPQTVAVTATIPC